MQNEYRRIVRLLKANGLSYTKIADLLDIRPGSLYNWLGGWFGLSYDKLLEIQKLADIYIEKENKPKC